MLTLTFNFPVGFPEHYADVPQDAWYQPFAGLATQYHLFLDTENPLLLHPDQLITKEELLLTLQSIQYQLLHPAAKLGTGEQTIARNQAAQKVTLYERISTRRTNVILVPGSNIPHLPAPKIAPISPTTEQLRKEVFARVNAIRVHAKLTPLLYSASLELSAQSYGDTMAKEGFFGHVSPSGQTLQDRIAAVGYYDSSFSSACNCVKGFVLGENLGRGQKTPKEVVDAWMQSPNHRAAILSPDYTDIGVGVTAGVWVQHFGGILLPGQPLLGEEHLE